VRHGILFTTLILVVIREFLKTSIAASLPLPTNTWSASNGDAEITSEKRVFRTYPIFYTKRVRTSGGD